MGPGFELFLLMILGVAAALGIAGVLTRKIWIRVWRQIVDTDRCQREELIEKERRNAEEAECRRRAEEELQRCLNGELDDYRPLPPTLREAQRTSSLQSDVPDTISLDRVEEQKHNDIEINPNS